MRTAGVVLALLLSGGAAAGAALIVVPAPSQKLALVAIAASERSALFVAAGLIALPLALGGLGLEPRARTVAAILAMAFALAAIGIGLLPLVQARGVARARGVSMDVGRYLRARIDDIPAKGDRSFGYAGDELLRLEVYLPKTPPGRPGRGLIVVHGGFWSAGEVGEASLNSRRLAELGFTVFDVEYRLAPQPNWREAVGDVKCAIHWVKTHATTADWSIDPNKVTLLGRSAGGHLALMAAYTPDAPELPASCPAGDTSVESVIALYAPTDLRQAHEHPANLRAADAPARIRAFVGGSPAELAERYRALSPTERVTPRSPRTLLAHGGRDQLVPPDQMRLLADRLKAAGVAHETLFIPYAQHAFDFVLGGTSSQLLEAALLQFLP